MQKLNLLILTLFLAQTSSAAVDTSVDSIFKKHQAHLEAFYKDLHENPELSGEDFGFFGKTWNIPYVYFAIGEKNEKDPKIINHSPRFAPDFAATAPLAVKATVVSLLELHRKQ